MKYADLTLGGKNWKIATGEYKEIETENSTIYLHEEYADDIERYAQSDDYWGDYLGDVDECKIGEGDDSLTIMMWCLDGTDIVIMQEFLKSE